MPLRIPLEKLIDRQDMSELEAHHLYDMFLDSITPPEQIAACLAALRMKGATAIELGSFAAKMRENSLQIPGLPDDIIDTCGTGGGIPSFNLSTGAAVIAAAAGVKVAKHGNRAVTSKCGSADVLEALGVKIPSTANEAKATFDKVGLCFLFAPVFHPAMAKIASLRRALGIRTIFNVLGPLTNPARAKRQLIGLYDREYLYRIAEVLLQQGSVRSAVVYGEDGLDEVSPCRNTTGFLIHGGRIESFSATPETFGISPSDNPELRPAETIEENAQLLRSALDGSSHTRSSALIPNAATTLFLADKVQTLSEGGELAREIIHSGLAIQKMTEWIEVSRSL